MIFESTLLWNVSLILGSWKNSFIQIFNLNFTVKDIKTTLLIRRKIKDGFGNAD
jgi:hypothetical protein